MGGYRAFFNLMRILQSEVGIGKHHLAIRPLNDPLRIIMDYDTHTAVFPEKPMDIKKLLRSYATPCQIIGIEFFSINHYLRNYLPWAAVQLWIIVKWADARQPLWRLDRANPNGEYIIPGTFNIAGFIVLLNNQPLSVQETLEFYNEIRKRELSWKWYSENNISWREVKEALESIQTNLFVSREFLNKLHKLGLLTDDFTLNSNGLSVLLNQNSIGRKSITFGGRSLL